MTDLEKKDQFDRWFKDLEELLKGIVNVYTKRKARETSGRKSPFIGFIEIYRKMYDKTEKEVHMKYFQDIYEEHEELILMGKEKWLKDGKIVILFGKGVVKENKGKIYLSTIYNMAVELKKEIQELLDDGKPEIFSDQELKYPDYILYYLYEIFMLVAPSSSIETLKQKAEKYRQNIGEDELGSTPPVPPTNTNDMMGNLMNFASNMFTQINNPSQGPQPNIQNQLNGVIEMVSKLTTNNDVKNLIDNLSNTMRNVKSPDDLVRGLTDTMNQPELSRVIQTIMPTPNNDNNNTQPSSKDVDESNIDPEDQE